MDEQTTTPNLEPSNEQVSEHLEEQVNSLTPTESETSTPTEETKSEEPLNETQPEPSSTHDLTKERDDRCIPVAKKLLALISENNPDMGILDPQKIVDAYAPIAEKILQLFLNENVWVNEIDYIFNLANDAYISIQQIIGRSLNHTLEICGQNKWGKSLTQLTMNDIDKVAKGE